MLSMPVVHDHGFLSGPRPVCLVLYRVSSILKPQIIGENGL